MSRRPSKRLPVGLLGTQRGRGLQSCPTKVIIHFRIQPGPLHDPVKITHAGEHVAQGDKTKAHPVGLVRVALF